MDSSRQATNIQQAVDFFRQAELSRLLELVREKYIELGRVGGQVVLLHSTVTERRNIASFLDKPTYLEIDVKIRLTDLEKALLKSRFACDLVELLNAFFPAKPLITRPQQRAERKASHADFHTALESIAKEQRERSLGQQWLSEGQHGIEWLYTRYRNEPAQIQQQLLAITRTISLAFNHLPSASSPERLAIFAQKMSGDPHFFDSDRIAGRLFRYALTDLASGTDALDLNDTHTLYASFGLLIDTISSSVAVYNLVNATSTNGTADPLLQTARSRILLLPLRQVLEWQSIAPATNDIYIFENPQVFEEVIDGLPDSLPPHDVQSTLLCTSGWPSSAALRLLDLLVTSSADVQLHYSGDFDLAGLKIAAFMLERYAGQCSLWHMDSETYKIALLHGGLQANRQDVVALGALPDNFQSLVQTMQQQGQWAYQEGVVQLLLEDLLK
jgi:uncharacterized protein (TIGR02679 family)